MKKQYFLFLVIACMLIISKTKAQNTPIDDLIKKYGSQEGVTNVSISQQMLKAIFNTTTLTFRETITQDSLIRVRMLLKVPEAYSSISISKTDISANLFADIKKTLLSSKYEQFMEINKENSNILGYYLKKVKDNINEIVVLRQQKDQFSAIYIKGDIDIDQIDKYLSRIRTALSRMGATNHIGMFQPDLQFAFTMPDFDDLKMNLPNFKDFDFKFDSDALKLRMEESPMKGVKDMIILNEDFHNKLQEAMEKAQKQLEDAQKKMEDTLIK